MSGGNLYVCYSYVIHTTNYALLNQKQTCRQHVNDHVYSNTIEINESIFQLSQTNVESEIVKINIVHFFYR